ncbi:hypothetical protein MOD96_01815 [Bacillus sp. S17B2]|uniref:hypothetical protein n=1 Tax=Bacillus sp. S17B2 TaxID=2918907 RepID=UPI002280A226|nr:hypothetical protein [Bacillus sp. S17B2]
MRLYTDDAGETLNYRKDNFFAWSKPSAGNKEITVIPEIHIVKEVYETERDGMGYLLHPSSYDFKNMEAAE